MKISLSKTTYMEGLRCPRLLWLRINQPSLAEPIDSQTAYLFEMGHHIEEYARKLFPGGVLIGDGKQCSFSELLADTTQAMESKTPSIYEATFSSGDTHCRTDILHRTGSNGQGWSLGEVKMCTKQKPEHIDDVAFQYCCVENAGYPVFQTYLVHINNEYVRHEKIEPEKLFAAVDITKDVMAEAKNVPGKVQTLINLANASVPPRATIGSHCKSPGKCPFYGYCHNDIPAGSIFELPFSGKLIPFLLERNIALLTDIPADIPLSQRQAAQVRSAKTGAPVYNAGVIRAFLKHLEYPLRFLDFETGNSCLPPFEGSSPYERIPFQYSLHIQKTKGGELEHFEFLPDTTADPRKWICEELIGLLEGPGSIIAWNNSFERSVLIGLGKLFPQYAARISTLLFRFVDLIVPFRSGTYADYRFQGSASLKKVLPVLVPSLSYSNMAIGKGDDASLTYQRFIDGKTTDAEWAALRGDLLAYCKLDTFAMVKILNVLYSLT